jgi:Mn-dependent DtxR family transcriptional regulator
MYVKALAKIASRYAPSRALSFDSVHLFKTLQLMNERGHVSRSSLCTELSFGDGVVRTLLRHLKMQGLINSTKSGTRLTEKGMTILSELVSSIQVYLNLGGSR